MKYIDLLDRIAEDYGDPCGNIQLGMNAALGWMDEHPTEVPGRTMTADEVSDVFMEAWDDSTEHDQIAIAKAFGVVVLDPEPTNTDQIKDALMKADRQGLVCSPDSRGYDGLAEWLDRAGFKAPEAGDDDE